jgi:hypothetical protein
MLTAPESYRLRACLARTGFGKKIQPRRKGTIRCRNGIRFWLLELAAKSAR